MSQFMFIVDIPPMEENVASSIPMNTSGTWLKFQNGTKSMKLQSASARQVSRNVWMLDAKNSLPLLLELSALANTCSLQYSAFLVEGEVTPLNGKTGGVAVIGPLKI